MSILSLSMLISLSRAGTIGQDEVKILIFTVSMAFFKSNQGVKSTIIFNCLFDHCRTRDLKHWSMTIRAYRLWKPVISFAVDFLHPLGYSLVKETVDPLQLYPLPVFKTKLGDEDKELWQSNFTAKFLWSKGFEMCQNVIHDLFLCSSIRTERLRHYVHFYI